MTLQHCPGWGDGHEDWLDECLDCQRRIAPADGYGLLPGLPPTIVVFECEAYISPDRPEDQRLRELAKLQGIQ